MKTGQFGSQDICEKILTQKLRKDNEIDQNWKICVSIPAINKLFKNIYPNFTSKQKIKAKKLYIA